MTKPNGTADQGDLWGIPADAIELDDSLLPADALLAQWGALAEPRPPQTSEPSTSAGEQKNPHLPDEVGLIAPAQRGSMRGRMLLAVAALGLVSGGAVSVLVAPPAAPTAIPAPEAGLPGQLVGPAALARAQGVVTITTAVPSCPMYLVAVPAVALIQTPTKGCFLVR